MRLQLSAFTEFLVAWSGLSNYIVWHAKFRTPCKVHLRVPWGKFDRWMDADADATDAEFEKEENRTFG